MSTGPHTPFARGEHLTGRRLNDAADAGYRANRVAAAPPLQSFRLGDAASVHDTRRPAMTFRVTGKDKLNPSSPSTGNDNLYSGVQQITTAAGDVDDLGAGTQLQCYVDYLPLVEVGGRTDVPEDAFVTADVAPQGDHLIFRYWGC